MVAHDAAHLEKKNHRLAGLQFQNKKVKSEQYAQSVKLIDDYLMIICDKKNSIITDKH